MGFKFSKKLTGKERSQIRRAYDKFHKQNAIIETENKARRNAGLPTTKQIPATKVIKELRAKGLSYSENNMYHDIRRMGATFNAKTPEARERAGRWFDSRFEVMRKKKGLTAKQAYKVWERAKKQSYENMTESELQFALELREIGSP